jgi:proteasome-associated ATPase
MGETELRDMVEKLKIKLQEQDALLEQLTAPPFTRGVIVRKVGDFKGTEMVLVAADGKLAEIASPKKDVKPGVQVRLGPTGGIVETFYEDNPLGSISRVTRVVSDDTVEIDAGGGVKTAYISKKAEMGDRVIVDESASVVIKNLGKEEERFTVVQENRITWDDIGGLEQAKKEMVEAIELPFKHKDLYKMYGKTPLKGVLLYGPPGCGKTMLGKAAASSLADTHEKGGASGFMYVKGPELLSKWVGESEQNVRSIFERARAHKKKYGYPAIIFIDEADAILGRRGSHNIVGALSETIVPQFLSEMDGLEESGAMVLLSTNRPDTLDPAVVRDGRIDRKVHVPRPTRVDAVEIFQKHLKGKPLACEMSMKEVAKTCAEALYDEKRILYKFVVFDGTTVPFTLGHMASGAMCAGLVDHATSIALHRELESEKKVRKHGITEDDIKNAADRIFLQNLDLHHEEELSYFQATLGQTVRSCTKMVLRS